MGRDAVVRGIHGGESEAQSQRSQNSGGWIRRWRSRAVNVSISKIARPRSDSVGQKPRLDQEAPSAPFEPIHSAYWFEPAGVRTTHLDFTRRSACSSGRQSSVLY